MISLGSNFSHAVYSPEGFLPTQETRVPSLGQEGPWERSGSPLQYLAGKTPWTEEPGGLRFMGLQSQT